MKKFFTIVFILVVGVASSSQTLAQRKANEQDTMLTALKTVDPGIVGYFPRWEVCEPNLQAQIAQTFRLYGRPNDRLDPNRIRVTAAPKSDPSEPFTLLLVECGDEVFVASEIDQYMKKLNVMLTEPSRPYCYRDMKKDEPPSAAQSEAIIDFMRPTNVSHSISVSAFEQSLKIGSSGFWLRHVMGTDQIGYQFWSSGENHIILQRPLYINDDVETRKPIPYLINAYLGAGYKLRGALENRLLDFIPARRLNSVPGKGLIGFDLHAPFHPQFGISVNLDLKAGSVDTSANVDTTIYASYAPTAARRNEMIAARVSGLDVNRVVPVLGTTGQVALFYNWWLDPAKPENFFRVDLGVNYTEFNEFGYVTSTAGGFRTTKLITNRATLGYIGLREFSDWVYAKIEYRNQSDFPFGVGLQYSNQMLMARGYLPLFGQWLYLEGKYSTSMRSADNLRPWELKNFFMVSPVLRLNIR